MARKWLHIYKWNSIKALHAVMSEASFIYYYFEEDSGPLRHTETSVAVHITGLGVVAPRECCINKRPERTFQQIFIMISS